MFAVCFPIHEVNFFVKSVPEEIEEFPYRLLQRTEVGHINLYKLESAKGQPHPTSGNVIYYMEKEGRIELVYVSNAAGDQRDEYMDKLRSFFTDDEQSMSYINSDFRYKGKEVEKMVEYYNKRNFEMHEKAESAVTGKIYVYRTHLQQEKSQVDIHYFDEDHRLFVDDFIIMRLPIAYPVKVRIEGDFVSSTHIMSAEFTDQYFELVYDKKANRYEFERKDGTELKYEFFRIRNKAIDN